MIWNKQNKISDHFRVISRNINSSIYSKSIYLHSLAVGCWDYRDNWDTQPTLKVLSGGEDRLKNKQSNIPVVSEKSQENVGLHRGVRECLSKKWFWNDLKMICSFERGRWIAGQGNNSLWKGTEVGSLSFGTAGVKGMYSFETWNKYLNVD